MSAVNDASMFALTGRRSTSHRITHIHDAGLVLFLLCIFCLGLAGVSLARVIFILGCAGFAYRAWCMGPGKHLETSIILFASAPLLRRVIDLRVGFDESGYMLIGPLLGLAPACIDLYGWLIIGKFRSDTRGIGPYALMSACLLYGWVLSNSVGDGFRGAIAIFKTLLPMLYGLSIMGRNQDPAELFDAAIRGFALTMPIAGLYGIYQYLYVPEWDRYWLIMVHATAMGAPEPMKVRVFSSLNSPESYAHFCAAALLLVAFAWRRRALALTLCLPIALGLLLSLYRSAWLASIVSLLYCSLYRSTRRQAGLIGGWVAAGAAAIISATPLGEAIVNRLSTLTGSVAEDGSGAARLGQLSDIYAHLDAFWLGGGFGNLVSGGPAIIDGAIVVSIVQMGLIGGILYLSGIFWAAAQALMRVAEIPDVRRVTAGAVVVGLLFDLPLSSITIGEAGFLFWTFTGIASLRVGGKGTR